MIRMPVLRMNVQEVYVVIIQSSVMTRMIVPQMLVTMETAYLHQLFVKMGTYVQQMHVMADNVCSHR